MVRRKPIRIGIVAPSNRLADDVPDRVRALAAARHGDRLELIFHPQCFLSDGHFAGPDAARADALVDMANDRAIDAIWSARGGYGANRIAQSAVARFGAAARRKPFLGYSDSGFLLAALMKARVGIPVHAPMPGDIRRQGGEDAVARSLAWLAGERAMAGRFYFGRVPTMRVAAFNLSVLASLIGTPIAPRLAGRVLMVEEVDEELYRVDRMMFAITSNRAVQQCAGLMMGRVSPKPNVSGPDWGPSTADDIARHWCAKNAIAYLGPADIGHDNANSVVPFG